MWTEATGLPRAAALLLVATACIAGCGPGRDASPPDVLLITLDTLRADYVHAYGSPSETTPNIDSLAERGALFETAIAASSRTVPSHASMMTSRFARQHSVGTENGSSVLEGHETLAARFRAAGYRTGAFVSNFVLKRRSGLDDGFDEYDDEMLGREMTRVKLSERVAEDTVARALAWLSEVREMSETRDEATPPVFLWVHLQDPHGPYRPPAPYEGSLPPVVVEPDPTLGVLDRDSGRMGIPRYQVLAGMRRPSEYATRYAEEIFYADHWLGELLRAFDDRRAGEGVILLTADHGESFGEDGFYFQHGQFTSPAQAFVPLLVVAPGIPAARHAVPVSHVDIAPTLLELAGLAPLASASGVSLVSLMAGAEGVPDRVLYVETKRELSAYRGAHQLRVRAGAPRPGSGVNENPIRSDADLLWRAFRRVDGERVDVPLSDPQAARLERDVRAYLASRAPTAAARAFSEEDVKRLRALGYLPGE